MTVLNAVIPLVSLLIGSGITYWVNVRSRRQNYVEDLINQAIAAVTAAEESVDWTTSIGKPALMSDDDHARFQAWLITEGLKNWNTRVTDARLALARVMPYVPEVEDLLPFAPDGTHRGTHRKIVELLRQYRPAGTRHTRAGPDASG